MTDIDMEHGEQAGLSTATPKLRISDRTCDTPGAVELALEFLPAFDLGSTEVVLVELFIDSTRRGQRLIEGSSSDRDVTFVVANKHWRADERSVSTVYEACFHITYGTLICQAPSEPTSLTRIEGNTYRVLHRLANQNLHEHNPTHNNDISGRNKADDPDHESSQETFYDARSQFEHMPGTFPAEEDPIVEDSAGAGDDSPANSQHISISGQTEKSTSITTSPTEDDLARLDRARREIFQESDSSGTGTFTASSPSLVYASLPQVQDPDTKMLDDLAEQSEDEDVAPRQRRPMQTFGTIVGFLSSSKTAAQYGMNHHSADPDDEAENLVHNRKPLRRTSFAPPGSALQSDRPDEHAGSDNSDKIVLTSKDGSIPNTDETRTKAPRPKMLTDPAAKKASKSKWDASGGRVNNELRKRLADNDEKIAKRQKTLKLWQGKNFGTDSARNAANIRLCNILKKQVKLHDLLVASTDANAAVDLRRKLQRWADERVDEYENQLDAILSAVQAAPSNDRTAPKQQASNESAEDSSDDFALPLRTSQQREMAAALLSDDQPVRNAVEAKFEGPVASDQHLQPSTAHTMDSRAENTAEDSDHDELPAINDLFTRGLPRGSLTKTQPVRNAGKSAERPKKKPRIE